MGLRSRWIVACALSLAAACAHEATTDVKPRPPSAPAGEQARVSSREADPSPVVAQVQDTATPSPVAPPAEPAAEAAKPESQPIDDLLDSALGPKGEGKRKDSAPAKLSAGQGASGVGSLRGVGAGGGGHGYGRAGVMAAPMPMEAAEQAWSREAYAHIAESEFLTVRDQPLSTFSVDVDTASYSNVRRFLREGRLPPADAVRIEELVNYFDYDYPAPAANEPFGVYAEVSDCPWNPEHRLVHLGIQAERIDDEKVPPRNLVFLIDVSGSMQDPSKLPLLKNGMALLARNMRREDRISMVVYAGSSGLVLPSTSGAQSGKVLEALSRLEAGGSTNGAAGIELAYAEAQRNFIQGGVNRVILATDGDFNVGPSSEGELVRIIEEKRKSGVFLTVLGFGTGNLQDARMEQLADKGNGNYAYIDTLDEAQKVLVRESGATLVTVAKDVKLQVEFNPAHVASYRLVGYENRTLAARDFNDDKKDAGEIGAGHTVTALYEVVPVGAEEPSAQQMVDPLRYQGAHDTRATESGELLTVKIRYKAPSSDTSQLIARPLRDQHRALRDASSTFRFSAAVAGFGMLLRASKHKGSASLPQLRALVEGSIDQDPHGEKSELLQMMQAAQRLGLGG
jgi:Ca-activated chloride channel family protein